RDPIDFQLAGAIDAPLTVQCQDATGNIGRAIWPGPLQVARKHPWSIELIREQLARLGNTPFELRDVAADLPLDTMLPKSVLNDLRRQAVAELIANRENHRPRTVNLAALDTLRTDVLSKRLPQSTNFAPQLHVLVRTVDQLEAVLAWKPSAPLTGAATVYCDFEDLRRYRDAVVKARNADVPIALATLRVLKPAEVGLLRLIAKAEPEAILIRNLASLEFFSEHKGPKLIGDFSLNVANELTADLLLAQGLARLTPSYDLNWDQLAAMLERINRAVVEVVVHQHMPMFHMEHCVFAAMLSTGKDATDCGRPCDRHRVELRDRVGANFPLLADTGCRNTVFNSVAQSAAEYIPKMLDLGVRHFRVELLRETPDQVAPLLAHYANVIVGLESPRQTWRNLQVLNQLGVTRGTLQLA
ncbi:MAG TPA: DUF3656 domain-containing protein, partial [Pirellulales bacterium]